MNLKTFVSTALVTTTLMASSAFASGLDVSNAWARASAGAAKAGGAFLAVHNGNEHDHILLSASSDVAKRVELHTHTMIDGMMKMREVKGGIPLPAGETVMLQPGGYHVMMMGLHTPLKEGTSFPLTLTFDNGKDVTVNVNVQSPSAMGDSMGSGMKHGGMGHGDMKKMGHGDMKKMGHGDMMKKHGKMAGHSKADCMNKDGNAQGECPMHGKMHGDMHGDMAGHSKADCMNKDAQGDCPMHEKMQNMKDMKHGH
ncbi:MAG: hypothetical protein COB59_00820 [Rhodospirillaceae bacterium]|nr:MAG: hypothetical protein COB59_00820 [Rhodospirillaceae bacterium]